VGGSFGFVFTGRAMTSHPRTLLITRDCYVLLWRHIYIYPQPAIKSLRFPDRLIDIGARQHEHARTTRWSFITGRCRDYWFQTTYVIIWQWKPWLRTGKVYRCQKIRWGVWIRNQLDVTFVLSFISPLQVTQHVSGNHVSIFRSCRLRSVIATCWYCAVAVGRLSEPVSRYCVRWGVLRTPQRTQ